MEFVGGVLDQRFSVTADFPFQYSHLSMPHPSLVQDSERLKTNTWGRGCRVQQLSGRGKETRIKYTHFHKLRQYDINFDQEAECTY
jgi:hypothetical protein